MDYVLNLQRMVARHLPIEHEFICLTDRYMPWSNSITPIDISKYCLKSWFAKMLVFNRELIGDGPILYIDLDMIIAGSLLPLVGLGMDYRLYICENFTQIRQNRNGGKVTWPCGFGSCVMLLGDDYGNDVWEKFCVDPWGHIHRSRQFGDQYIIENLTAGHAIFLQDVLPEGYFLHYKDFTTEPDPRAHVLVFAGKTKPVDCKIPWIRQHWDCR